MKAKVYSSPPANIFELRERIIREFEALQNTPELVSRAVAAMQRRSTLCIERGDGHVEGQYA